MRLIADTCILAATLYVTTLGISCSETFRRNCGVDVRTVRYRHTMTGDRQTDGRTFGRTGRIFSQPVCFPQYACRLQLPLTGCMHEASSTSRRSILEIRPRLHGHFL